MPRSKLGTVGGEIGAGVADGEDAERTQAAASSHGKSERTARVELRRLVGMRQAKG
jgi:hypothetical protein